MKKKYNKENYFLFSMLIWLIILAISTITYDIIWLKVVSIMSSVTILMIVASNLGGIKKWT